MGNIFSVSLSCDGVINSCWRKATYTLDLEENLDVLKRKAEQLEALSRDITRRITIEEGKHLQRLDRVQAWLSRAEIKTSVAQQLIRDGPQQAEKLCLGSFCSKSCKASYKFAKSVAENLNTISELLDEGDFTTVVAEVVASGDERPCEPTVGLEDTFEKVWSCFASGDQDMGIIGVYGIGGVGKTTLLTRLNNRILQFDKTHHFDFVIWVVVSKDHDMDRIQSSIGKQIGFLSESWMNKSQDEKSIDIYRILCKNRFVLLLDDIWERVDLIKFGVPLPNEQNKSKVVFTTRSEEVCGSMEAHKKIKVECLEQDAALSLFRQKVGEHTFNSHPEIPKLAETMARFCGGLPLALVTIGRAMACKRTPREWHHAIDVLNKSASQISGMEEEVLRLLKFSYDSLPNPKAKSCLLYCSLFPRDFILLKSDLIDYWIGEGILGEIDSPTTMPRNEGYHIMGTLIRACLLEEVNEQLIKMHDVIRDMALWIIREYSTVDDSYFVQASAQLYEVPKVLKRWQGVKRMSLIRNHVTELDEAPICPHLVTLLLRHNPLETISNAFFRSMALLTVLDLSHSNIVEFPLGVCALVSLQYVNLSWTKLQHLPIELKKLVKLKCLLVEYCDLKIIPAKVIFSLPKLQVLRVYKSGLQYFGPVLTEENILSRGNEFLVQELLQLEHLNLLTIDIKSLFALQKLLSPLHKLRNHIEALSLAVLEDSLEFDISFLETMTHLEELSIIKCRSLDEIKASTQHSFKSLHVVHVEDCSKLRDLTWIIYAPNLITLMVVNCCAVKEIISVEKVGVGDVIKPFGKLEFLMLHDLPQLKSVYWEALCLPNLGAIQIRRCPRLQSLPLNSNTAKARKISIRGERRWWDSLSWEDAAAKDALLPSFVSW